MSVAATARRDLARSRRVETCRALLSGTVGKDELGIPDEGRGKLTADCIRDAHLAIFVMLDLVLFGVELARTE